MSDFFDELLTISAKKN